MLREHQRGTARQRGENLLHRRIERQRRKLQNPIRRTQTEPTPHPRHMPRHRPTRHPHTLRPPRRTRRINHIRQLTIHHRNPRIIIPTPVRQRTLQHHTSTHIRTDELHPLRRPRRIQRHIHTTGLQHTQHRNEHVHTPPQPHPHRHLSPHTPTQQPPSHPVRPRIQLRIRHHHITRNNRHPLRNTPHPLLEQHHRIPRQTRRHLTRTPTTQHTQLTRRQTQTTHPNTRRTHHTRQQHPTPLHQPTDRHLIEHISPVLHEAIGGTRVAR